jgi:hypothetical protein
MAAEVEQVCVFCRQKEKAIVPQDEDEDEERDNRPETLGPLIV